MVLALHAVDLPHLHSAAIAVAMRGGPRHEQPHEAGLTHFLEHMLFRGAGPYLATRDLFRAFEEVGEEPDAYTTDDSLVIVCEVDPRCLGEALDLLGEVLLRPRFGDLEEERAVIMEEHLERVDDRGRPSDLGDVARALAFPGQGLGRSILGSMEAIAGYQLDDLERMRKRLIRTGNMAIAVAGPCDVERVLETPGGLVGIPGGPPVTATAARYARGPRTGMVPLEGTPQVELRFTFLAPGQNDPSYPALQVLADVLDGGAASRVPVELVDSGLCYQALAELEAFPDFSLLEVELIVARKKTGEAVATTLELLGRVAAEGVTDDELELSRRRREHRARRRADSPREQAEWAAARLLQGLPLDRAAAEARQAAVTAEDVVALAGRVIQPRNLTAVLLGQPGKKQRKLARKALEAWKPASGRVLPAAAG